MEALSARRAGVHELVGGSEAAEDGVGLVDVVRLWEAWCSGGMMGGGESGWLTAAGGDG